MALRIKELCKEKHITMAEIAERFETVEKQKNHPDKGKPKIGINPVTLTQTLKGNPTLSTLQKVADILGVDVSELFERPQKEEIYGCLYVNGSPVLVSSKAEIERLLADISK